MEKWSTDKVCSFIAGKGFQEDIINLFSVNRISGEVLLLLSDGDLKELGVAALGYRNEGTCPWFSRLCYMQNTS